MATVAPTQASADATPTAESAAAASRERGQVDGVTFVVGEGSEATFTVNEKLANLPLPNDAVVRTTSLSGEIRLDGGPTTLEIDLHTLSSDQSRRDGYIRNRMFPNDPTATFTVDDVGELSDGFSNGQEFSTEVSGTLSIRGEDVPLTFEISARDDGAVLFVLGRTSFTWDDLGIPTPNIAGFVQVNSDVKVEVLLKAVPTLE